MDDDGAVWTSIPSGMPDPDDTEWRMIERIIVPQVPI